MLDSSDDSDEFIDSRHKKRRSRRKSKRKHSRYKRHKNPMKDKTNRSHSSSRSSSRKARKHKRKSKRKSNRRTRSLSSTGSDAYNENHFRAQRSPSNDCWSTKWDNEVISRGTNLQSSNTKRRSRWDITAEQKAEQQMKSNKYEYKVNVTLENERSTRYVPSTPENMFERSEQIISFPFQARQSSIKYASIMQDEICYNEAIIKDRETDQHKLSTFSNQHSVAQSPKSLEVIDYGHGITECDFSDSGSITYEKEKIDLTAEVSDVSQKGQNHNEYGIYQTASNQGYYDIKQLASLIANPNMKSANSQICHITPDQRQSNNDIWKLIPLDTVYRCPIYWNVDLEKCNPDDPRIKQLRRSGFIER